MKKRSRRFLTSLALLGLLDVSVARVSAQEAGPILSGPASPQIEFPRPGQELLPPPRRLTIPLAGPTVSENVRIEKHGSLVSLVVRDVPLNYVITLLGQHYGLNVVCGESVNAPVSLTLERVKLDDALNAVCSVAGYTWVRNNDIIQVTSTTGAVRLPAHVQNRKIMVFTLDYASAAEVELAVKGLLSPVGQVFSRQTDPLDNRKTQDAVIVEDLADNLARIEQYIATIDQAPRQVMIEARILQVELSADNRHGVNFSQVFSMGSKELTLEANGMANPTAPQAFFFNFDATDLDAIIECLKTTTDAKTLASPRVMALNGQQSRLQVGEQLGFRVTTTTETSTLESVEFLDVGVVLQVTPRITRDGQVLMHIKPEVSTGQVNPQTGLPEEETTEVETQVMLASGRGIVIGGLIQEKKSDIQSKVPWLGDLWMVGRLFQKRSTERSRSEIIIVLLPRIVPYDPAFEARECLEIHRATTPLVDPCLNPVPRPWEGRLPDAIDNPIMLRLPPITPPGQPVAKAGVAPQPSAAPAKTVEAKKPPAKPRQRSVKGFDLWRR